VRSEKGDYSRIYPATKPKTLMPKTPTGMPALAKPPNLDIFLELDLVGAMLERSRLEPASAASTPILSRKDPTMAALYRPSPWRRAAAHTVLLTSAMLPAIS
jgi:hypothetical protein